MIDNKNCKLDYELTINSIKLHEDGDFHRIIKNNCKNSNKK